MALGRLADFLSISFLNFELQIAEPVHRAAVRAGEDVCKVGYRGQEPLGHKIWVDVQMVLA